MVGVIAGRLAKINAPLVGAVALPVRATEGPPLFAPHLGKATQNGYRCTPAIIDKAIPAPYNIQD